MRIIKILQYGSGNIGSLVSAFSRIGFPPSLASDEDDICNADLLILPGVGSAKSAIQRIRNHNFRAALQERHEMGKPILGICLGAQLVFEFLEEAKQEGLGWLPGEVKSLQGVLRFNNGWASLAWEEFRCSGLSRGLGKASTFYFNHQYYLPVNCSGVFVPIRDLPSVPALFLANHLCGFQFHPEKSQRSGLIVLRNVVQDHYGF